MYSPSHLLLSSIQHGIFEKNPYHQSAQAPLGQFLSETVLSALRKNWPNTVEKTIQETYDSCNQKFVSISRVRQPTICSYKTRLQEHNDYRG